jgi:transcriptional regulator with XRE-family HTH domain
MGSAPGAACSTSDPVRVVGRGCSGATDRMRGNRGCRATCDPAGMVTRERRLDRGRRQARRGLTIVGEEFRESRLRAGLTQRQVADAIGISHTEVSRIERGVAARVPYVTLVSMGAALGLDVPLRAFPNGDPIRDAAQLALLARLRVLLPAPLTWRTEVPLNVRGDQRAWDAVIGGPDWRVPVDAESRLRDVQACTRRVALKKRDDGSDVVILLVADTRHNRRVLRLAGPGLAGDFPMTGPVALAALRSGEAPSGSAILLL